MTPSSFSFSANPNSSAVNGIAYTEEGGALVLIMESGSTLLYTGVPKTKATGLMAADSVGDFYNREIRNKFPYLRVGQQEQSEIPAEKYKPGVDLGTRHNTLHQIATDMVAQKVTPEAVKKAVQDRNTEFAAPLPLEEVESILKKVLKK